MQLSLALALRQRMLHTTFVDGPKKVMVGIISSSAVVLMVLKKSNPKQVSVGYYSLSNTGYL